MRPTELPYVLLFSALAVCAPFLPTLALQALDVLPLRVGVAVLLLYLTTVGEMATVFGFVGVGLLYMERNRRKVAGALTEWSALAVTESTPAPVAVAHAPQTTVPVAPFDVPEEHEVEYQPLEEPMDISAFEPVAPSINEKVVLASSHPVSHVASTSTASLASIYEQLGFGHVAGVETVGH